MPFITGIPFGGLISTYKKALLKLYKNFFINEHVYDRFYSYTQKQKTYLNQIKYMYLKKKL